MRKLQSALACCGRPLGVLAVALVVATACGQATERAVFVANNGNLEGSVTAFTVDPNGMLTFVNRVITGTRPNTQVPCPGCNPYRIAISPSGRYLATGHASSNDPYQQITIYEVAADASVTQIAAFMVPSTPMDVVWITDEYLATCRTSSTPNKIVVYRFLPGPPPTITLVDEKDTGGFSTYLALHPSRQYIYINNSGSGAYDVYAFAVDANGVLTLIDAENTGSYYALELGISHDGTKMYAAGGITYVIDGFHVMPNGTLNPMAGSPFPQFGTSPSNVAFSSDDQYLLVGHGTDATVRSAAIDAETGALTYTGNMFDVGLQGTLGDVQTLDDQFFVTDNSTAIDGLMGIYSFTLLPGGAFQQNGPIVSTGGIAPRAIAVWKPPTPPLCPGDTNCDGLITYADIDYFVEALAGEDAWTHWPCPWLNADCNGDSLVTYADIDPFVALIGTTCP